MSEMKPDDVLAILRADRLPECSFDNGMTWVTDDVLVAETFSRAANALEALIAEIAALRGDVDAARRTANDEAERATQAERQRDEAAGLLRPFAEAADDLDDRTRDHDHIWEQPAAMNIDAGNLRAARTFLASIKGESDEA